ncbi:MAG: hypothetical protein JRH13_09815 [Deltaproteobacteria bacterium]|nr:hypothetical protein [Deltaproteobacteria bacterium]
MAAPVKLGGFKVLKGVIWFSLISDGDSFGFPAAFCRRIAEEKINLPFFSCQPEDKRWSLNVAVSNADAPALSRIVREFPGTEICNRAESIILSIFPYRGDPEIVGLFLEALGREGLEPLGIANSPAAVSAVLHNHALEKANTGLFKTFQFSAYRTPQDWNLAQKGKESLYREVVASYQESKPKVYGIRYRDGQEMCRVKIGAGDLRRFASLLKSLSGTGTYLSFLGTRLVPPEKGSNIITLCFSRRQGTSSGDITRKFTSSFPVEILYPVAGLSMTGPHFGDRYGIASELLTALEAKGVMLLGLNCSIASIKAVVDSDKLADAIEAIQSCFEVPALVRKD